MQILKIFILVLINAGGEGKTTIARLIRVILQLSSCKHLGLDADHGSFALMDSSGEDLLTKKVGWSVGPDKAVEIVQVAGHLPVIMDTGASMLASQRDIVDLLPVLRKRFSERGYRTVALLPISPNKIAAPGALADLAPKLNDFETFVVRNDRDGSGEFGDVTKAYPEIAVHHLAPGLNAYLTRSKSSIIDAMLFPKPGYVKAAAYIADWVRLFAEEPQVQGLLGANTVQIAIQRLPAQPPPLRFVLETYDCVNDEAIARNEYMTHIMRLIDQHTWSVAGLRGAADELERCPPVL